jgi:hypothetical protein
MSRAYVIEVHNRTAGIVTGDERGFSFFSSERTFDSLEGCQFSSARDAELAVRALFNAKRHRRSSVGLAI